MTAFYIIAVILIVLCLLSVLPVTFDILFDGEFRLVIRLLGIKVYSSDNNKKNGEKADGDSNKTEDKEQKTNKFSELKDKYGFTGAVKYGANIISLTLKRIVWFVRRLKFRKFVLDITVASDNAAKTGIEYGLVCSAVYPIITFLETNADFRSKQINIRADFDITNPDIKLSVCVKTYLVMAIFTVTSALRQYNHLVKDSEGK